MTSIFWLMAVGILLTLTSFFLVMAIYNTIIKADGTRYWWFIFVALLILVTFSFLPYHHF